jgi:inorganic pyrophosphatase
MNNKIKNIIFVGYVILTFSFSFMSYAESINSNDLKLIDKYTLAAKKHLLNDIPALNENGDVNVVIEIPTGTVEKWEVDKETGNLIWEFKKGKPRVVSYIGYPGNYGMIPSTLLSKESGGDGDPLDVLVLGPAVPRGSVVSAKVLGVLKLNDDGEQDDKLIAVLKESKFYSVNSILELNKKFPGISDIINIWFANYKGPGRINVLGYDNTDKAISILNKSIKQYSK